MSNSNQTNNSQAAKWLIAICIFAAGVAFAVVRYRSVQAPVANAPERRPERQVANSPERERPRGEGRPSREERQAMREQMLAELNLTPEQEKQMEEAREQMRDLPRGPEGMEQRIAMMAKILTPEQMQQARQSFGRNFGGRMANRMRRGSQVLSQSDQAKLEKKIQERQAEISARVDRVIEEAQREGQSGNGTSN